MTGVLSHQPGNFFALSILAEAYANTGRKADAKIQYTTLVEKFPDTPAAWIAHGDGYLILGQTDIAKTSYRKALQINPHICSLYRRIADIDRTIRPDDPLVDQIRAELKRTPLSPADESDLHMSLAYILDHAAQHKAAFPHFEAGNRCRRSITNYKEKQTLDTLRRVQESFPKDMAPPSQKADTPRPVFVVGMPRSGTTLVEQILDSHSRIYGAGERPDVTVLAHKLLPLDPARWPEAAQKAKQAFATGYMQALTPLAPDAAWIVDKMPHNGIYAGLIRMVMPDAKFIWVERNAMDCAFSCYRQIFAGDLTYTYDQAELGHYIRAYTDLMRHWEQILPPDVFLHIRYEDLIAEPESKMRQLIGFCGLEWQEQCLHFEKNTRPVATASVAQVRQPLNKNTGGRWKPYADGLAPLAAALAGR